VRSPMILPIQLSAFGRGSVSSRISTVFQSRGGFPAFSWREIGAVLTVRNCTIPVADRECIGVIKPFGVLRRRRRESKTPALTPRFSILEGGPSGPQSRPTLRCRRLRRDPDLSLLRTDLTVIGHARNGRAADGDTRRRGTLRSGAAVHQLSGRTLRESARRRSKTISPGTFGNPRQSARLCLVPTRNDPPVAGFAPMLSRRPAIFCF
jgi:hypothetical protein